MNKRFTIVYVLIMATLFGLFFLNDSLSDSVLMVMITIMFISTSVFIYSGRKK